MNFSKYTGLGNDFILIDNRGSFFPSEEPSYIRELCDRRFGIGADGVILFELSKVAQAKMRIFNCDGSEAEMCGNGIRCFMQFLIELGFSKGAYQIETFDNVLTCTHIEDEVKVQMNPPIDIKWDINLETFTVDSINTGVPHAVLLTEEIKNFPLEKFGPYVRNHEKFSPKGTNFTVAEEISPKHLLFRTFERGIEGETLACGTGACAAALSYAYKKNIDSPIRLETISGGRLTIEFTKNFDTLYMTGPAKLIFKGSLEELSPVII